MKSHVALETNVCVVCGQEFDTDAILLHKRLQPKLNHKECTGWGMCPEHEKMREDGYIALIGCDEDATPINEHGVVDPADAYRTGFIAHIKTRVWQHMFNVPVPDKGIAFVSQDVLVMLEKMQQGGDGSA